jgi:hypothetical protein
MSGNMKDMHYQGGNYTTSVIKIGLSYIVCYTALRGVFFERSKNYPMSYNNQARDVA